MATKKDGETVSEIRDAVLSTVERCLDAQLRAVRRLRTTPATPRKTRVGRSQVDTIESVLRTAGQPLHINEIIERAHRALKVELDRESVVSALSKKVLRGDRFVRTGPNEFGLKTGRD